MSSVANAWCTTDDVVVARSSSLRRMPRNAGGNVRKIPPSMSADIRYSFLQNTWKCYIFHRFYVNNFWCENILYNNRIMMYIAAVRDVTVNDFQKKQAEIENTPNTREIINNWDFNFVLSVGGWFSRPIRPSIVRHRALFNIHLSANLITLKILLFQIQIDYFWSLYFNHIVFLLSLSFAAKPPNRNQAKERRVSPSLGRLGCIIINCSQDLLDINWISNFLLLKIRKVSR